MPSPSGWFRVLVHVEWPELFHASEIHIFTATKLKPESKIFLKDLTSVWNLLCFRNQIEAQVKILVVGSSWKSLSQYIYPNHNLGCWVFLKELISIYIYIPKSELFYAFESKLKPKSQFWLLGLIERAYLNKPNSVLCHASDIHIFKTTKSKPKSQLWLLILLENNDLNIPNSELFFASEVHIFRATKLKAKSHKFCF